MPEPSWIQSTVERRAQALAGRPEESGLEWAWLELEPTSSLQPAAAQRAPKGRTNNRAFAINDGNDYNYNAYDACDDYGHVRSQCPNLPGVKVPSSVALKLLQDGQKRAASSGPG